MPKRTAPPRKASSGGAARHVAPASKGKPSGTKPAAKPKRDDRAAAPAKKPAPKASPNSSLKSPAKNDGRLKGAQKTPAKPSPAPKSAPAVKPAAEAPKPPATPAASSQAAAAAAGKAPRKGITIVNSKSGRRPTTKPPPIKFPVLGGPLIKPGAPARKPLIASGPNAPPRTSTIASDAGKLKKTPFDKRQLAKFRSILLQKRAELVGDVSGMETEALMGQSGSLSHLPQHMAEQGSDAYGQSLSLDLAAVDRRLIREIDDALARIEAGTYGVCELTGKPIKAERLEELPWARYSIEAARELERRNSFS